jgi:hypothetical protein
MRPANTTRASVFRLHGNPRVSGVEEPPNSSISFPKNQENAGFQCPHESANCERERNARPQKKVLLLDGDAIHSKILAEALEASGLFVILSHTRQSSLELLKQEHFDFAIVVFRSRAWWKEELRCFCDSIWSRDRTTQVVCVLRWIPDGPDDRLFGDTLNVGVLHEF